MFGTDGFVDDDDLKRRIEEIRGEPLRVIHPQGDEWTEVSDRERLCSHPVVSVLMITYNHEKYIAQTLESIVTQKTDFEFELIIGEDASTDRTREICLDYQRRYPQIVRVLYPKANTFRKYGCQVFNLQKVYSCSRGEFGAMCEGDDYWIDDRKLAKQVAVMRAHPNVSFCWTRSKIYNEKQNSFETPAIPKNARYGVLSGRDFWRNLIDRTLGNINTPSYFWRLTPYKKLCGELAFYNWDLLVGDVPIPHVVSYLGDAYRMEDISSVYRVHGGSVCRTVGERVASDNVAVSAYFSYLLWHLPLEDYPRKCIYRGFRLHVRFLSRSGWAACLGGMRQMVSGGTFRRYARNPFCWIYVPLSFLGHKIDIVNRAVSEGVCRFVYLRIVDFPAWFIDRMKRS